MKRQIVNLAIVGYGAIADFHALAFQNLGARLIAVVGPNGAEARAFAQRHSIPRVVADLKVMLAMEDVDAVVVASPSAFHSMHAAASLSAGKHVLCEIPVGMSWTEAKSVEEAARDTRLIAMACHTQRYWPSTKALLHIIARDQLVIRHVIGRWAMRRHENIGWTGRPRTWVDNVLWHHGAHTVDTALRLLAEPVNSVYASVGPPADSTGRVMDVGVILRTTSDALATLALSYNSMINENDYLVVADDRSFLLKSAVLTDASGSLIVDGEDSASFRAAVADQDGEFLAAIALGSDGGASIESAMTTVRVLQHVADQTSGAPGG